MTIERTRHVGTNDKGDEFAVRRLINTSSRIRNKPCKTCPWRRDAEIGEFPAEAYRTSASCAYDTALTMFSCHESGTKKAAVCAGFLLANSNHNMGVRLGVMKGTYNLSRLGNPDNVELYSSYRAMAIANGVDPQDPRIAACRGDNEDGFDVRDRIVETGAYQPKTDEDRIDYINDRNNTDL